MHWSLRSSPGLAIYLIPGLLLLGACGGDECEGGACLDASPSDATVEDGGVDASVDAGPEDAGAMDAEPIDFGPRPDAGFFDAGSYFGSSTCLSAALVSAGSTCNPACPPGSGCIGTPTERYCVELCNDDLDGCLDGFTCLDVGNPDPLFVCLPPAFSCLIPGTSFGTICAQDTSACQAERQSCQGDVDGYGYCTDRCDQTECPTGYACATGDDGAPTCLSSIAPPGIRCATEGSPTEVPCIYDGDCVDAPGPICAGAAPGRTGVCAALCEPDASCSPDHVCRALDDGRSVCMPERCACRGEHTSGRDLFGEALEGIGLDRCSAVTLPRDWSLNAPDLLFDPYRLSFTNGLVGEPWRAPLFADALVDELDLAAAGSQVLAAADMIASLSRRLDRPALDTEPPGMIDGTEPLATAVAELITSAGGIPNVSALRSDAEDVPMELQLALATVIDGIRRAALARTEAFSALTPAVQNQLFQYGAGYLAPSATGVAPDPSDPYVQEVYNELIDYGRLYGGAIGLLEAVEEADLARFAVPAVGTAQVDTTLLFNQETPIGRVAIGGGESGLWDGRNPDLRGDFALIVDLGGNDVYSVHAGGTRSSSNFVSLAIDLSGADDYGYVEAASPNDGNRLPSDGIGRATDLNPNLEPFSLSVQSRQGAGRTGIGILIDFGDGDDEYRSLRMSQGTGIFGVGALIDEGGDDRYRGEALVQGAGMFGIGVLLDAKGNDTHEAYQAAQGFGFARGGGVLYDALGADDYELDVGDPAYGGDVLYPAAQRAENNASLGQGFGFGRRGDVGDPPDRAFMSGGLGALVDGEGDDRYLAGIFAQGSGYWWGTGILADKQGNDHYDSFWYGMGTAAHYALGLLLEGAGDDVYGANVRGINVTIGGGHDFSTAFVVDESGDDEYHGSRITLGCGNSNGRGFFIDNEGNDDYAAVSRYSIGSAGLLDPNENFRGSPRRRVSTIGVFVDAGGIDQYVQTGTTPAGIFDDTMWLQTNAATIAVSAMELGSGIDGIGDSTIHTPWSTP